MQQRRPEVVVAGHVCLDITPAFGQASGKGLGEVLRPGKLLRMEGVRISPGGAVGNTGPALHRLGIPVALMGKCGNDPFGRLLLERLRELAPGAEAGMHVAEGENTSYTIVIAPPGIDRIFLHCPDANDTFGPEDVDLEVVARARLFHFGYPPLMKRMYGNGGVEAEELLGRAAAAGAVTSLDLSLPDPDSDAGRADWHGVLARMLPHADLFLPSLDEILFMLERERFAELVGRGGSVADGIEPAELRSLPDRCLDMGASVVVIKCGHLGAYLKTSAPAGAFEGSTAGPEAWQERELFEPSCRVERVASATGAGDSAIAGFLAAWLKGEPPERCMAFLAAVGAQNLAGLDAVSALKSWDETCADLDAGLEKNPVPPPFKELMG
ncbi:MAG: carbohydrate kinase family protein [Candidatus Brocadiae bacterium]|nr:carbohydrate kinase family protein [Candidatus Brocadiia bacterium]